VKYSCPMIVRTNMKMGADPRCIAPPCPGCYN
jgi:hypothetical protein